MSEPNSGLPGRTAEALILLVAVLTISSLVLVPAQGATQLGVEVLLLSLIGWGWLVAIQLLHLRDWQSLEANLRWNFVGRVVLSQVAICHSWQRGSPCWGGVSRASAAQLPGMVFSILAALFGAWVRLVEIKR